MHNFQYNLECVN